MSANIFYRVFFSVVLLLFFLGGTICMAQDIRADTLKQLEQSINKIEDIQCTLNVVQTGSTNPDVYKYMIEKLKVYEKSGFISSQEARGKIASATRDSENNKDFTLEHPAAKWKMKQSDGFYNELMDDGVQNYDGIRKIVYNNKWKRGEINSELKIPTFNPYFALSINNMSIVEFFKLALKDNNLTVSPKDDLIEISGMVFDKTPGQAFLQIALKY